MQVFVELKIPNFFHFWFNNYRSFQIFHLNLALFTIYLHSLNVLKGFSGICACACVFFSMGLLGTVWISPSFILLIRASSYLLCCIISVGQFKWRIELIL